MSLNIPEDKIIREEWREYYSEFIKSLIRETWGLSVSEKMLAGVLVQLDEAEYVIADLTSSADKLLAENHELRAKLKGYEMRAAKAGKVVAKKTYGAE